MKKIMLVFVIFCLLQISLVATPATNPQFKWRVDTRPYNPLPEYGPPFSRTMPIAANVDDDPQKEVFFVMGNSQSLHENRWGMVLCIDGLTGEVQWIISEQHNMDCHTCLDIADVTGDGNLEIIIAAFNFVGAFNARTGEEIWRVYTLNRDTNNNYGGRLDHPPLIIDINGITYVYVSGNYADGCMKIRGYDGAVVSRNTFPRFVCNGGFSAADLNGDGNITLIRGGRRDGYDGKLYRGIQAYDTNLNLLWNHKDVMCSGGNAVLIDIDGNGDLEIIPAPTTGVLTVVKSDGTKYPGKWVTSGFPIRGHDTATIYDLDGDGHLELLTSNEGAQYIYVVNLSSFKVKQKINVGSNYMLQNPVIANVLGDSSPEILSTRGVYGQGLTIYDLNWNILWFSGQQSSQNYILPTVYSIADIDNDGYNEIFGCGYMELGPGAGSGWLFALDTEGVSIQPQRTDTMFYGERRNSVEGFTAPLKVSSPGPSNQSAIRITNLSEKWNLISLSFNHSTNKKNLLVKKNGVDYSWQEAVNQSLILDFIYNWDRTTQKYCLTDTLNPGHGYRIYAYQDCELVARNVSNHASDFKITNLLPNWNLIGVPYNQSVEKETLAILCKGTVYSWSDAVLNRIIMGFIYEWNEPGQYYHINDTFLPGKGYWIYSYLNCTILRPTD